MKNKPETDKVCDKCHQVLPKKSGLTSLSGPSLVWGFLHAVREQPKEHFIALYLDVRDNLIYRETISIGTLTASLVHPREVFAPALEKRAAGIIVAHNHPSGDPEPSPEDRSATRRLVSAGKLLGIGVLDHVIVTKTGFFSFKAKNLL